MFIGLPKTIFHYCKDAHPAQNQDPPAPYHQHKILYRRSPNLPCSCNNTSTKVFMICASDSIYFGPWIYGILYFRNFAQRVNICYIAI